MDNLEVEEKTRNGTGKGRESRDADKIIGARLRKLRTEIGMSQKSLAEAINVTTQQVQKYERGISRLAAARLLDIAQAMGVTPATLLGSTAPATALPASRRALELLRCFETLDDDSKEDVLNIVRRMAQPKAA